MQHAGTANGTASSTANGMANGTASSMANGMANGTGDPALVGRGGTEFGAASYAIKLISAEITYLVVPGSLLPVS